MQIENKIKDMKAQGQIKQIIKQWGQKKAFNHSNMLFKLENHEIGNSIGSAKTALFKAKLDKMKNNIKLMLNKSHNIKLENVKVFSFI